MQKNLFRKTIIVATAILLAGASIIPNISGNIEQNISLIDNDINDKSRELKTSPDSEIDHFPNEKPIEKLGGSAHMGVKPSSPYVIVGQEFNISIYIDPDEAVGGWEIFQLNFTQGKVEATEVLPGSYWTDYFDAGNIDNTQGTITTIQTWTNGSYPNINHTACVINFTALKSGICSFEIGRIQVNNATFYDMDVTTHNATILTTTPPIVSNEYPVDTSINALRPPSELSIDVQDSDEDSMDVYIRWKNHNSEWITIASYTGVSNGTYNFIPSYENDWIWGNTTYTWSVNISDGAFWTNETYSFTTGGSRFDVSNNDLVNFQDAGQVWVHRSSEAVYDGLYDVSNDGQVNFQDAGLTWINRE